MDTLIDFLADRCEVHPSYSVLASKLYGAYRDWCTANGEEVRSQTWFGRTMGDRGFPKDKAGIMTYWGIALRS